MTHAKESSRRLPRNTYTFWLYSGGERFVYQVAGPWGGGEVEVVWLDDDRWRWGTVRASWLRGSARELADALVAEPRYNERDP